MHISEPTDTTMTHVMLNDFMCIPEHIALLREQDARDAGDPGVFAIPYRKALACEHMFNVLAAIHRSPELRRCLRVHDMLTAFDRALAIAVEGRDNT